MLSGVRVLDKYNVNVTMKNGKDIYFQIDQNEYETVISKIQNKLQSEWFGYKNANGEGYFRVDDVSQISFS